MGAYSAICFYLCCTALGVEAQSTKQLFSGGIEASDAEAVGESITGGALADIPTAPRQYAPAGYKIQCHRTW